MVKANTQYNEDKDAWTALADNTTRVVKGSSEHSDNEKGFPTQSVRMEKKFPVKFKHTKSGKACASTSLAVKSGRGGEILWFTLIFWNELAETVAWHLKMNDSVYVSGFFGLGTTTGADDKLQRYKVIALFFLFPYKIVSPLRKLRSSLFSRASFLYLSFAL